MTGCQKVILLVLSCAVVMVCVVLFSMVQSRMLPVVTSTPSPIALHTPTPTHTPVSTAVPTMSATSTSTEVAAATPSFTSSPPQTPSATPTPLPSATLTATAKPSPTSTHTVGPTVPTEVQEYVRQFVGLVTQVHGVELLAEPAQIGEGTVNELRGVYSRLHDIAVPEGAGEMHLSFITYVSLVEEKYLCHLFAEIHAADAQGPHYLKCENRATTAAADVMSNRFIPTRDTYLQSYSLNASEVGFPY